MTDNELNPEVELEAEVEVNPTIEFEAEVDANPTIELQAEVDMGSAASERNAEAWAVGERRGVPVSSTDQTYHNNAKYYALQIADGASDSEAYAVGKRDGVDVDSSDPAYHNNAKYYAEYASQFASLVDDTAGVGDTNKVWSADKDVKELDKKAPVINGSLSTESAIQEIPDGANGMPMKVVAGIEPVQDLHGFDFPWVGGAGKNKWSLGAFASWNNKPFSLPAGTYTVSADTSSLVGMRFFYGEGNENSVVASLKGSNNYTDTITLPSDCIKINTSVSEGGTVENVQIEAGETKTTYEPYENICPISGWTGAKITTDPENIFVPAVGSFAIADGTLTIESNGVVTLTPVTQNAATKAQKVGTVSLVAGHTYYFTGCPTGGSANGYSFDIQRGSTILASDYGSGVSYTPENNVNAEVCFRISWKLASCPYMRLVPCISESNESTTYNITFPSEAGTVYGGELTVNKDGSGTLVVDRAALDISQKTWAYNSNGYFNTSVSGIKRASSSGVIPDLLQSDRYKADTPSRAVSSDANLEKNGIISIGVSNNNVNIRNYAFTDPTLFAASGGTVVYPLATAVSYSLTPGQVKTLLGINSLWADVGKIKSVDYCADTKTYIDSLFASILPATGVSF